MNEPFVCIITGPAGAGKSTIAKELAKKYSKSAVIDNDYIRQMIVGGYVMPWPWNDEAKLQTELAVKNIIALIKNFTEQGFTVFIDIVLGKKDFDAIKKDLSDKKIFGILLLPTIDKLLKRFDNRGSNEELRERTKELHERFSKLQNEIDIKIFDTSNQTIEETTEKIYQTILSD